MNGFEFIYEHNNWEFVKSYKHSRYMNFKCFKKARQVNWIKAFKLTKNH